MHLEEVDPSLKVLGNWKKNVSSFFCFQELVNLQVMCKPFRAMVIIDVKPYQDDEVFYNRVENFTIW
jgi:hypothetical protein